MLSGNRASGVSGSRAFLLALLAREQLPFRTTCPNASRENEASGFMVSCFPTFPVSAFRAFLISWFRALRLSLIRAFGLPGSRERNFSEF